MRTRMVWLVRLVAVLGLAVAVPASAAGYAPHDLGTLGANGGQSIAYGINGGGVVVGESQTNGGSTPLHATVWFQGRVTDLGTLGGSTSVANAVSNNGLVVGYADVSNTGYHHGFMWDHGTMIDLGRLGAGYFSNAYSVNNSRQVVGESDYDGVTYDTHAFLWQNGTMTDLAPNSARSTAHDINAAGQIVGWLSPAQHPGMLHATLWQGGQIIDLGVGFSGKSYANGINELGQVVGYVDSGPKRAVTWVNGQMTYLAHWAGGGDSIAYDVNNAGQIVGQALTAGGIPHAVLWQGGQIIDLGTLGGRSATALAINGTGQIVGWSAFAANSTGPLHATLWSK